MSSSHLHFTCVELPRADWPNIGILLHTLPGSSISGVHQEEVPLSALYQTPVHILTQGVVAEETLANCHISFVIVHFTENQCILDCSHHWSKVDSDLHTRSLPVDSLFDCRSSLVEALWWFVHWPPWPIQGRGRPSRQVNTSFLEHLGGGTGMNKIELWQHLW